MKNESGHIPVEFKVLLKPDEYPEVTGGGIIIPASVRDRYALARTRATILAIGGNCFEDWSGVVPKVGDRVRVAKYQGEFISNEDSADGKTYQLVNDKDILTILSGGAANDSSRKRDSRRK